MISVMRGIIAFCLMMAGSLEIAADEGQSRNFPPYSDADWFKAKCRFRGLRSEAAYGHHPVLTLKGCLNSAMLGLMFMANDAKDESGVRHVCRLESKKDRYDHLRPVTEQQIFSPNFYDLLGPEYVKIFDQNFEISCDAVTS